MSFLVLVRHGKSIYNEIGLWAGWDDPDLTPAGEKEAVDAGNLLKDIHFDAGYTSSLVRQLHTLEIIKQTLGQDFPVITDDNVKERNYGDLTAKNKWQVKEKLGEEAFQKLRRSWDYPIPNGESLKQVSIRISKYYESEILPRLKNGENIIISSSGNTLRALVKYLENISDDDVTKLEIATGQVYVYTIDSEGNLIKKEIRNQKENTV